MEDTTGKYAHIKGWGIDADPQNNPTYPMKHYDGSDHQRLNYERPPKQLQEIEVLHSNERPSVSRVFGTSTPPSGLSGMIRRFAFRYSESSYGHWVPLVLADRIGVVEGIIDDLKRGIFPNIIVEKGLKSEWKYNRTAFVTRMAVTVAVAGIFIAVFKSNKKDKKGHRLVH